MLWTDEVFLRLLALGAIGIALGEWGHSWWKGQREMNRLREGRVPTYDVTRG